MKSSFVFHSAISLIYRAVSRVSFTRRRAFLLMLCLTISGITLWLGASRARMASFQSNVPAGSQPVAVAVNSVTNKVYAANFNSNNVTVIDGTNHATTTVPVGTQPRAVEVNPVTNKIYVANQVSDNVTVIDGADNSTATVVVGDTPYAIAVNSVTNKIYVANQFGNNVTVIDGADNSTTTVPVGTEPRAIAVNPVTNKIYVTNFREANLTVINGADNSTGTIATGEFPIAVAVNPVTNKVYVPNFNNRNITVINCADNSTVTVQNSTPAVTPSNVVVNPVTNKIYVSNFSGERVTILNGADNTTSFVNTAANADSIAVNPVSNKIYVTSTTSAQVNVIDGVNNSVQVVSTGTGAGTTAYNLAINPVTNKIYVVSLGGQVGEEFVTANIVSVINGADNSSALVTAGTEPYAVAVNPVTNKAYVANRLSNNVTVVNGADNTTATVPAGTGPVAIAVNAVTNKTYVANHDSNDVTVINGADNSTVTLSAGTNPLAIAVNAITNKIYVANETSNNVTIINGADNSSVTIPAGPGPTTVAINQVTNKTYVLNNFFDDTVTVINGADNSTVTVHTGAHFSGNPFLTKAHAIAVNSVTNKIYVANSGAGTVTVINGVDNSTATVALGVSPLAVAVNSITNKIYVSASNGPNANVTVINGADNTTVTIPTHSLEYAIAVDEATNEIYVANVGPFGVTLINGADNSKVDVPGERALDVAINPVTHKLYLANQVANKVSIVTEQNVSPDPLTVSITPEPFQPNSTSRSFTFAAASAFSPIAPPVRQIHYQLDTWMNPWQTATPVGANPQPVTFGPLQDGMHILYAYATDGGDTGNSPHIGQIQSYLFFINSTVPPPPTITAAGPLTRLKGNAALSSTIANVSAGVAGSVTVTVTSSNPFHGVAISNIVNNAGTITADVIADCTASDTSFTLRATDTAGGFATATLNVTVADDTNDPPFAGPDTAGNIAEDSGVYSISAASLLVNDNAGPAAEANQTLTVISVSNPVGGSAQVNGANVEFTPTLDFNGAAGFDYTIQDNGTTNCVSDPKTATAHVSFNITPINDAPSFTKGADQTVDEDAAAQSVPNWATNVSRGGGTDEAGQTLIFNVTGNTNPALFSVAPAISPTGTLSYTTAANRNGSATITLTLNDNGGGTATSGPENFTITVTPVNDAPTLTNNTGLTVDEGSGNTIDSNRLSVSDIDNSDDQLVFTLTVAPARGTLLRDGSPIGSNGTFTQQDIDDNLLAYSHDGSETTSDSLGFTVADGAGGSVGNTTFNIAVNPVDDPPDINSNNALLLNSGATATIHKTNLQATDPDTNTITFIIDAPPDHGQLKLNGTPLSSGSSFTQNDIDNDRLTYTNNGDEFTFDTFGFHLVGASFGSSFDISITCETSVINTNDAGPGSLRNAIVNGCQNNIISFSIPTSDPNYDATTNVYTIKLNSTLLINKNVSIQGPGTAGLKISGENSTRVFSVNAGHTVTLANLTIANGQANRGGGIYNLGDLTISNTTLTGNNAAGGSGQGGAIDSENGNLTVVNSTISGNTAEGSGGGLFNSGDSRATLINVTITGNRSDGDGSDGLDSATGAGGGVAQVSSNTITLSNTIVAGNRNDADSSTIADDIFAGPGAGTLTAAGSLIGDASTAAGIANGSNGNKVGNAGSGTMDVNAVLDTLLANNGGTTGTHLLKVGSPALDAGDNALAKDQNNNVLNTDQRGFARIVNTVDIGALEVQAGVPVRLVFTGQPSNSSAGATINPVVTVQILDEGNNPTTSTANVTISIGTNPAAGTLGGTRTVAAVNGTATFSDLSINNAAVGYTLVAGSTGLAGITSNLFNIEKATQSIIVGAHAPASATYNTSFTVAATSSSGLAVAYSNSGNCTNVGPVFTMTNGSGTCTVNYAQSGDSNYNAATQVAESVTAQKVNQTINVATHAPANAAYNTSFSVAATSNSGLAVAYSSSGACTNVGPVFTMTSGAGTCTVKYDQSGDSNYNAATQLVESVSARKAHQSITVGTHAPASTTYNTSFNVAATSDSGLAAAYSSSGVCTNVGPIFTMTAGTGTCSVKYDQAGDTNYNAATQATDSVTAQKASQTINVATHAPANATYKASFTVAATSNSGQAIVYSSSGACTNVGPTFTMANGTGTCTVKYAQSGDSNYNAATQVSESVIAQQTTTTMTVSASLNPSEPGQSVTFTATVSATSGTPTGTVQFKIDGTNSGSPVTLNASGVAQLTTSSLTAGTHMITTDYSGDGNFAVNTGTLAGVSVAASRALVTLSNANFAANESTGFVTITVSRTGNLAVPISVDYTTDDTGSGNACSATNGLASSRCDFNLTLGTLQFAANETQKTLVIPITQDSYTEGPETFTLGLSNLIGTGAAFATPSSASVTISDGTGPLPTNAIDDTEVFVRQQYRDFLNRDADPAGLAFWKNNIDNCNAPGGAAGFASVPQCIEIMRINTSAAFFLSIEFQSTGNLVRSFYVAALDRPATNGTAAFAEFERDTQAMQRGVIVGQGNWQQTLNDNRDAFTKEFVMRPEFVGLYPTVDSPAIYITKLYQHALGRTPTATESQDGVSEFPNGATQATDPGARGRALLRVTQATDFQSRELNRSFVQMEYFGYLRRNPNDAPDADFKGYDFWLNKLNASGGNYIQAEMVKAFLKSSEYRQRFGP